MPDQGKLTIFLSHAGEDRLTATDLANRIKNNLHRRGYEVEVFNTSEPEFRFKDIKSALQPGESWEPKIEQYDSELTGYLKKHLRCSVAYILLVTRRSLMKNSEWITMEIIVAKEEAEQRKLFFVPCVIEEVDLLQLPEVSRKFFWGRPFKCQWLRSFGRDSTPSGSKSMNQ